MNLTTTELSFVQKRRKRLAAWPWLGGILLLLLLGFTLWLWVSVPLMINPWAAMSSIEAGTLTPPTLTIMAAMLPVVMAACLFFMIVSVLLFFAGFGNERRLLTIIERHSDQSK